jgi:serine protease
VAGGANLPSAWAVTQGAATVRVAVVDTGAVLTHPDLQAAILPGYDFISSTALTGAPFNLPQNFIANDGDGRDADPSDPGDWVTAAEKTQFPDGCDDGVAGETPSSWHGTHMAGIVAAAWGVNMANGATVPGTTTAGLAPNVRIVPVRALGKCGGVTSDVIDAVAWAAGVPVSGVPANANPAQVINLSLGAAAVACSAPYQALFSEVVVNRRVVVVAATGNGGSTTVSQPANCAGVVGVTAHIINGESANYADVGPETSISAPGGGAGRTLQPTPTVTGSDTAFYVWSTYMYGERGPASTTVIGGTTFSGPAVGGVIGTSPAAPHVSATAAMLLSLSPALAPATVREIIRTSARAHPTGGFCSSGGGLNMCGAGLLDAGAALTLHNVRRPSIPAIAAQTVAPSAAVTLTAAPTSNSGAAGAFTYAWMQTAGTTVTLNGATAASASFTAPAAAGTLTFSVTATDSNGYRSTQTAQVTVSGSAPSPAPSPTPSPTPAPTPAPAPSSGGGGALPLWPVLLLGALSFARRLRRID